MDMHKFITARKMENVCRTRFSVNVYLDYIFGKCYHTAHTESESERFFSFLARFKSRHGDRESEYRKKWLQIQYTNSLK